MEAPLVRRWTKPRRRSTSWCGRTWTRCCSSTTSTRPTPRRPNCPASFCAASRR